ncbi:MAG TPA: glycosyltransferase family 39 protein [Solirubrobacteraceae bacterium]|nr:glycosyltransferase family 39 protein [Solirubrobacteraceae bacterium]
MTVSTPVLRSRAATINAPIERLVWSAVLALLVVRLGLSWHAISDPGLQQDETLFVNAATLRIPGDNIAHSIAGVPVMVFPYIGALKSWIYDPLFAVFGNSATVVRVPAVVITSLGLLLVYPAVRDLVNRPVALLAFVALCFDNSVFWLTRDDVGPSALEFALKCAALFCAARFARSQHQRWVLLLLATLALGVFNKLNFIWIVNAATVASVMVGVRYRDRLRSCWRLVATWLAGLAVIYAAWAIYYFHYHIGSLLGPTGNALTQPWARFDPGTSAILSGTWFYDYALAPLAPRSAIVWIVLVLFAAGAIASVAVPRLRNLPVAALAVATVLISLQTLVTVQATAGWHYVAMYPFVTIVAAYGVYAVAHLVLARRSQVHIALACAGILALAYDGLLMSKYFDALGNAPTNSAWSPAIYNLSRDLRHSNATIFAADWGIFNSLFALEPTTHYRDLAFALRYPLPAELVAARAAVNATPGRKLVVTHVNSALQFPDANVDLLSSMGAHLNLVRVISGPDHKPVYAIYRYR